MAECERACVLALLWALWGTFRSLLIWPLVSTALRRLMGQLAGCYRLLYNSLAAVTLIPVLALHFLWRSEWVVNWSGAWLAVPIAIDAAGLSLMYLGARSYKLNDFMGFKAARAAWRNGTVPLQEPFSAGGVLRYIRHPWYAATLCLLWGHDLDACGLAASLVLTIYVLIGTWLEERKLTAQFGEAYLKYRRDVPAFVPWALLCRRRHCKECD